MKKKEKGHWDLRREDKVEVTVTREPERKVRRGLAVDAEFQQYN